MKGPANSTINTPDETFSEFLGKVSAAAGLKKMWVETSLENIMNVVPDGLSGKKYICFKGVKVCEFGKIAEIEIEEAKSPHDRMHPDVATTVVSGAV